MALLFEFGIAGRKRDQVCSHIVALAAKSFSAERAEEILAEMRRAQERTKARKDVYNVPGLVVKILEEYAETGQMVLFELPPEAPAVSADDAAKKRAERERKQAERQQAQGKNFRYPQAVFTDEDRRRSEEEARKRNEAREAAKQQQNEATH